jgi:hypothetical protein
MHEQLGTCLEAAKSKINWMTKIHGDPFTLNDHYLADYKEKFLTYYRRVRQDARTKDRNLGAVPGPSDNQDKNKAGLTSEALSLLTALGYEVKKEDLNKLLGQDMMEPALEIMATVRAYFQGMSLLPFTIRP